MFKIYVSDAFWWTVPVPVPTDDGWVKWPLEVQYRHYTAEAFDAFMERVRKDKLTDLQILEAVLLNWRKVAEEDGTAVPYSAAALQRLCRTVSGAAECLAREFIACHAEAARKN